VRLMYLKRLAYSDYLRIRALTEGSENWSDNGQRVKISARTATTQGHQPQAPVGALAHTRFLCCRRSSRSYPPLILTSRSEIRRVAEPIGHPQPAPSFRTLCSTSPPWHPTKKLLYGIEIIRSQSTLFAIIASTFLRLKQSTNFFMEQPAR